MRNRIEQTIRSSINLKRLILENKEILENIEIIVRESINAFKSNRKMLLCGNGGSAADAQHIASELSGRFYRDRGPLFAEALHVNTSFITAVANDYGYENVYSRMVEASGKKGDVLIAISTSGSSANVIKAISKANEIGMLPIGLTGEGPNEMSKISDIMISVPCSDTPRVQESHILIGHIISELIEEEMF